jgi:hypothetical protein
MKARRDKNGTKRSNENAQEKADTRDKPKAVFTNTEEEQRIRYNRQKNDNYLISTNSKRLKRMADEANLTDKVDGKAKELVVLEIVNEETEEPRPEPIEDDSFEEIKKTKVVERYYTLQTDAPMCKLCLQLMQNRLPCRCIKYCDYCLSSEHLRQKCNDYRCLICDGPHQTNRCRKNVQLLHCRKCGRNHRENAPCLIFMSKSLKSRIIEKGDVNQPICADCRQPGHLFCSLDNKANVDELLEALGLHDQNENNNKMKIKKPIKEKVSKIVKTENEYKEKIEENTDNKARDQLSTRNSNKNTLNNSTKKDHKEDYNITHFDTKVKNYGTNSFERKDKSSLTNFNQNFFEETRYQQSERRNKPNQNNSYVEHSGVVIRRNNKESTKQKWNKAPPASSTNSKNSDYQTYEKKPNQKVSHKKRRGKNGPPKDPNKEDELFLMQISEIKNHIPEISKYQVKESKAEKELNLTKTLSIIKESGQIEQYVATGDKNEANRNAKTSLKNKNTNKKIQLIKDHLKDSFSLDEKDHNLIARKDLSIKTSLISSFEYNPYRDSQAPELFYSKLLENLSLNSLISFLFVDNQRLKKVNESVFYEINKHEDGNLKCIYSDFNLIAKDNVIEEMDKDHLVPRKLFDGKKGGHFKLNLHNLFPASKVANNLRAHKLLFLSSDKVHEPENITSNEFGTFWNGDPGFFIPKNNIGVFARAWLYSYVKYNKIINKDLINKDILNFIIQKASSEPVSDWEKRRNFIVEKVQFDRNPFVDLPHLALRLNFQNE